MTIDISRVTNNLQITIVSQFRFVNYSEEVKQRKHPVEQETIAYCQN